MEETNYFPQQMNIYNDNLYYCNENENNFLNKK
jgi:hypothetical protein